jgi:hypothetical protein
MMNRRALSAMLSIFAIATALAGVQAQTISLDSPDQLKLVKVKAETVTFKGRKALQVRDAAPPETSDEGRLVILPETDFQNGVIEVDLAGEPGPGAGEGRAGLLESRSALRRINLVLNVSICGLQMDARKISCVAIIQFNTFPCRASRGMSCARNFPRSTRLTSTWLRQSGPG